MVKSGGDGNTYYANTSTTFGNGETITGATRGATATTNAASAASIGDFDNQYVSIDESFPLTQSFEINRIVNISLKRILYSQDGLL